MKKYIVMRDDEVFVEKRPMVMPLVYFKRNCTIKYGAGLKFKGIEYESRKRA